MPKHLDVSDSVHDHLFVDTFDKLLRYCQKNNILFADKQFPNNSASLHLSPPHREYDGKWSRHTWARLETILGKNSYSLLGKNELKPIDIRQGGLGDCYFLCSLSSMAEQPDLIHRLFYEKELNKNGIIGVWLFIDGMWDLYIIDEYFPCTQAQRGLDFAFSKTVENDVWVVALEKAYAKAYGSYFDIVGGDPVHALRDLSGAPYDRIEDYADLPKAWKKLKEADANKFILTCFTKSGATVEARSGEGIVSGHAYSILNVKEIVDSRGQPRMILQIRNPWGKFEWNGEFSDKSPLWTPQLKTELNVVAADDGVFWIPFEQFVQFYEGIGILKVRPGFVSNAVMIKRIDSAPNSIIRMTISDPIVKTTISIDQVDSRTIDVPEYAYSYFRITIGRIDAQNKIEFIDTLLSPERSIFIEADFVKGDYIILVEPYWSSSHAKQYVVGTYSSMHTDLDLLPADVGIYKSIELEIWRSFTVKNKAKLQKLRSKVAQQGNLQAPLDMYTFTDQAYGCKLYATFNTSSKNSVHQSYKIITNKGYDVVAAISGGNSAELLINPNNADVLMFKMNLKNESFQLSHQISGEEVLQKVFQPDNRVVEFLSQIGGEQPTDENEANESIIKSRTDRIEEAKNSLKENDALEKLRLKMLEDSKKKVELAKKEEIKFREHQQNILLFMAQADKSLNKFFNQDTKKIDPFFVVAESFKNIPNYKVDDGRQQSNTYGHQFYQESAPKKKECKIF